MARKQTYYSLDFKADALKYVKDHPELSVREIALYLGISKSTLTSWIFKDRHKDDQILTSSEGPMTEEERRIAQLERDNRDLKDALEVLKKAISILND